MFYQVHKRNAVVYCLTKDFIKILCAAFIGPGSQNKSDIACYFFAVSFLNDVERCKICCFFSPICKLCLTDNLVSYGKISFHRDAFRCLDRQTASQNPLVGFVFCNLQFLRAKIFQKKVVF